MTAQKQVLVIDMDEVIIEKFFLRLFNEFTGEERTAEMFTKPYMQDELGDNEKAKFFDYIFSRENVYNDVPLLTDARTVLEELNAEYDLYICSDYLMKGQELRSVKLLADKCATLTNRLPFIKPTQYIFMRNKSLLKTDIIIDDRPNNFGPNAKRRLLFTAYHNKSIPPAELAERKIERVNSWKEIADLLLP